MGKGGEGLSSMAVSFFAFFSAAALAPNVTATRAVCMKHVQWDFDEIPKGCNSLPCRVQVKAKYSCGVRLGNA